MDEYQIVDLFNSHVETLIAIFMAFVSTTSAFLIVTYLAASEFPTILARVTVGLYVITSVTLMGIGEREAATLLALRARMVGVATWHPVVLEPEWIAPAASYAMVSVMALLLISSMWFFIYTRRMSKRGSEGSI